MSVELWQQCVELLRDELPAQQFNTWIRPLQVEAEGDELRVYAPNRFVLDWVNEKYLGRLLELLGEHGNGIAPAPPPEAAALHEGVEPTEETGTGLDEPCVRIASAPKPPPRRRGRPPKKGVIG